MQYEPIVTIWLGYAVTLAMPGPIARLDDAPGQWVVDRPDISLERGPAASLSAQLLAVVVSASGPHMTMPHEDLARGDRRATAPALPRFRTCVWSFVIAEKRATYACTPQACAPAVRDSRPGSISRATTSTIEFPATLEAAVRSGVRRGASGTARPTGAPLANDVVRACQD